MTADPDRSNGDNNRPNADSPRGPSVGKRRTQIYALAIIAVLVLMLGGVMAKKNRDARQAALLQSQRQSLGLLQQRTAKLRELRDGRRSLEVPVAGLRHEDVLGDAPEDRVDELKHLHASLREAAQELAAAGEKVAAVHSDRAVPADQTGDQEASLGMAEARYRALLSQVVDSFGDQSRLTIIAKVWLGRELSAQGRAGEATQLLDEASAAIVARDGAESEGARFIADLLATPADAAESAAADEAQESKPSPPPGGGESGN